MITGYSPGFKIHQRDYGRMTCPYCGVEFPRKTRLDASCGARECAKAHTRAVHNRRKSRVAASTSTAAGGEA
jgi:RNA polymerase-binding transcription factor DksA